MAEETVYLKTKKIRLLSIDRLLEGEAPVSLFFSASFFLLSIRY